MKFKNFIKILCLSMGVVFAVACSDDDDANDNGGGSVEVTEPLPTPENVTYTSTQTTINLSWNSVTGATSYEASIAKDGSSSDLSTVEVTGTNYSFSGLEVETSYVLSLRALYSPNPEFNSEYVTVNAKTLSYAKLDTPSGLSCNNITETSARISWDAVADAANYRVILETTVEGTEIDNKVQTSNLYNATGLTEATSYTVSVQALVGDGAEENEYDSDVATITFETVTHYTLTAPEVKVAYKSHALAILEWVITDEMLEEQPFSSNADTYNFRLCDASGKVLREVDNDASFNFKKYPSYRLAWGGLTANTTYKLEMQRVSTANKDLYDDSEWASVEVTTDPAPDTSNYLLYWDFDNVPFNTNGVWAVYGFTRVTSTDDWANPDNISLSPSSSSNTIYSQTLTQNLGQTYCDTYLPGIQLEDVISPSDATYKEGSVHNITVTAGLAKFGSSNYPAWVTLPAFSSIPSNSTVYVEVDGCPYYEPGSSGDWYDPSSDEITNGYDDKIKNWFYISASGAKIESVEGETSTDAEISDDGTVVCLRNVDYTEMQNDPEADPYRYTTHKVKISGVGPSTRIVIYTALVNDGLQHRMWMDNLKVSLAE